jgi:phenylpyruvate tautomerase PptA (4-oxalocrotonate tautomerase family)
MCVNKIASDITSVTADNVQKSNSFTWIAAEIGAVKTEVLVSGGSSIIELISLNTKD